MYHTLKRIEFLNFAKRRVWDWLAGIDWGQIEFCDAIDLDSKASLRFGSQGPKCTWRINSPGFYRSLSLGGSMGLAESYMRGEWQCDDLTTLLRILYRADAKKSWIQSTITQASQMGARWLERTRGNTISESRKQIAAHYDLSNAFFELFLDPSLMYSSAYFEVPNSTLEQASTAKLDLICQKLALQPNDSVLEIGTGWGGFALHVSEKHEVRLTTTTISKEQFERAKQRVASANQGHKVTLLSQDYRHLTGQFDKIVSIEMIEAVGEKNLKTYFHKCGELLRPGGRMVIQAIVMPEQRYAAYRKGTDFIQKYIFPGGFLPSITAIQEAVGRTTDFRLQSIQDLSPHYATTLHMWRENFENNLESVKRLGFGAEFIRMWEYYLCYCEAAFREQAVRVVQIVWDRPTM